MQIKKILLLNPFHSGSHARWANSLVQYSRHDITLLKMPGVHWKWRMHGAAVHFAKLIEQRKYPYADIILTTDMMDLSILKSMIGSKYPEVKWISYFHENQLSYPWSVEDSDPALNRDLHYGFINFTNALVADRILFNSYYHKNDFLKNLDNYLRSLPDFQLNYHTKSIEQKAKVLAPGIPVAHAKGKVQTNKSPIILWNHRWEYDKNPETFFRALKTLKDAGYDFQLMVIGKSFKEKPKVFAEARAEFSAQIFHWGYIENTDSYIDFLQHADILPVFSNQEFFGISVLEAISNGICPLLPNRLAYPEAIPLKLQSQYLFDTEEEAITTLKQWLDESIPKNKALIEHTVQFQWPSLIHKYDDYFLSIH
jgi:glycosyltransferase involved in cell wall biosynthesis